MKIDPDTLLWILCGIWCNSMFFCLAFAACDGEMPAYCSCVALSVISSVLYCYFQPKHEKKYWR